MSTHNICFCGEIRKIICGCPLLSVAMSLLSRAMYTMAFPLYNVKKIRKIDLHVLHKSRYTCHVFRHFL